MTSDTDKLVPIGAYLCTGQEFSSGGQLIVIFRNSAADHGGNGMFRMPKEKAEQFTQGKVYELFARESDEFEVPKRLMRKRQQQ